ncbi:TonB-dependent receptor plug domain-containing protein [Tanticharoenia sakaeratensis]|uniref:TonB-dependent receptor of ferrichrome transport system n=1 Tax=Tanticharoenia sakaeratensis NBRC 103193 TaxID=1231623 RepID=A0A0D6MII3_9PROT|nr:TonB-dependent receptor [Tanticharoenia sakaeratensis]GAN53093.1 TonB-dependent receptor of ferrichrome transport system [Tanticharoenia sakaeratensis NBRC 103193]
MRASRVRLVLLVSTICAGLPRAHAATSPAQGPSARPADTKSSPAVAGRLPAQTVAPHTTAPRTVAPQSLPETVTVTAQRLPARIDEVGDSVTVVTADDIARLQKRDLPTLLAQQPGLNLVRTGGPGGTSSIFMRGTNANEVKVRLDGMEINDPSNPTAAFDPGQFLTEGLARVEVLRGPQSGLYGADAMGGVIDLTTKQGEGPLHGWATAEGGSFSTANQSGGIAGSAGRFHYLVDLSHMHVGSLQTTPQGLIPPGTKVARNRDDNRTASVRLGYDVTRDIDLGLAAHLTQAAYDYESDNYDVYPPVPTAQRNVSDLNQAIVRGTAHWRMFDGLFDQTAGLGYVVYRRRDFTAGESEAPGADNPSFNRGDRLKADWHGVLRLGDYGTALVGAEHIRERIVDSPVTAHTDTNAGFGQLALHWRDILFGSGNIRFDSNSRYGQYVTWRVAPAIRIPQTGTTFKASAGTGFHGPSLNQLFVSYPAYYFLANPNLKAERLIGYDAGIAQSLLHDRLQLSATWYDNRVHNLIQTVLSGYDYTYGNVAHARTYGVEVAADYKLADTLRADISYTWTVAKNEDTGQQLTRRPRDKVSASATWTTPWRPLSITPDLLYVSGWHDVDRYAGTNAIAHDYVVFDLAGQYRIDRHWTAFVRGENLGDRRYQNPVGYLQPGRAVYGGISAKF